MMKKNVKSNVLYSIPSVCVLAFLIGLFSIFIVNGSAYAAPSATLTLGTSNTLSTTVTQGNTAYLSSTIKAEATDVSNYTLSITGPTSLTGGTTMTGAGGKTPANMPNNSWGYSYNNSSSNENKTYTSFTGSAQTLESGTTPSGTAKNITFAAKFGDATAGHYTGSVTVSLVATPKVLSTFTLTYNPNSGTGGPGTQSCSTYGSSCTITIASTTPTRSGYNFLGWNTSSTATTADTNYSAGKTITMDSNRTIYAVWEKNSAKWNSSGKAVGTEYMQDIPSNFCNLAAGAGDTITLKDNRAYPSGRSNSYLIRKMENGQCWMVQNLRLTGMSASGTMLTPDDSNVSSNFELVAGLTSYTDWTNTNWLANYNYYRSGTGYYSWYTATAGTTTAQTASICPKKWHLPTGGGDTSDFYSLFRNMGLTVSGSLNTNMGGVTQLGAGDSAIIRNASSYNFTATGNILGGGISNTGDGRWWSRTYCSSGSAYNLHTTNTSVRINACNDTYNGFAVRCIAQ